MVTSYIIMQPRLAAQTGRRTRPRGGLRRRGRDEEMAMTTRCPKCGSERIELWLCDRAVGCTARPRCEGLELRQPALPFEADFHGHRLCLACGFEWASLDLGLDA